jgi:hypothetical protein
MVSACTHVVHATAGRYLVLESATWNGVPQPATWMARSVLFSTTTRTAIDDPAVIVRDRSTSWAEIGADERLGVAGSATFGRAEAPGEWPAETWLPTEHPATRSASTLTSDRILL